MDLNSTITVENDKSQHEAPLNNTTESSHTNNYKELYQDLMQQFECEKKLNNSMVDALENKVSELIAENDTLKISNIKIKKQQLEFEGEIAELKQKLQNLS